MFVIEGIDGVGKTTLVNYLVNQGMKKHHFNYDMKNMDLITKYMKVLERNPENLVLDRSFISEMVYGLVLRRKSKIDLDGYRKLLIAYRQVGTAIIYLTASKETLLQRRQEDIADYNTIQQYYESLNEQYETIMQYSSDYIDVYHYDTGRINETEIQGKVRKLVR